MYNKGLKNSSKQSGDKPTYWNVLNFYIFMYLLTDWILEKDPKLPKFFRNVKQTLKMSCKVQKAFSGEAT